MAVKLLLVGMVVLALSACETVSHQPPISWHQVEYPLKVCDKDDQGQPIGTAKLERARRELTSTGTKLDFNASWVCVTSPLKEVANETTPADGEMLALANPYEVALRDAVETPFVRPRVNERPRLGIALAGGGVKAGAFATGVLAGLADGELLDSADYISSVSGGSYAAYFYFAHRVFPMTRPAPGRVDATSQQLFWDCVRRPPEGMMNKELHDRLGKRGACDGDTLLPAEGYKGPTFQAFLRCQQDVFNPGVCNPSEKVGRLTDSVSPVTLAGTVVTIPVNWVTSVFFDWGLNVSQVAHTYRRGIGMAYGTTLSGPGPIEKGAQQRFPCDPVAPAAKDGFALDCSRGTFLTGHKGMEYRELREAMLKSSEAGNPMPFWIINATSPRYRSAVGWVAPPVDDITNSDMFEMTAVSQGSGRWGYVPAPMSLHKMDVMDSVAASAAFADSSEIAVTKRVERGSLGVLLRFANFDWGSDIPNYNVTDWRRNLHKSLPIPLYWTDSGIDRTMGPAHDAPDLIDRQHTAYIRLIDGGNAENLGLYSLLKRRVRNVVVADSASDSKGLFEDLCAFRHRLKRAPDPYPKELYIPGLKDFHAHCDDVLKNESDSGYPIREWKFSFPVLVGCLRERKDAPEEGPCSRLGPNDVRLLVVKPAVDLRSIVTKQTDARSEKSIGSSSVESCWFPRDPMPTAGAEPPPMNCETTAFIVASWKAKDGACQTFPQHPTGLTTLNSSAAVFSAYRELGRQYLLMAQPLIANMATESGPDNKMFETYANDQYKHRLARGHTKSRDASSPDEKAARCDPDATDRYWPSANVAGKG